MSKSYPLDHASANGDIPRIGASTSDERTADRYENSPLRVPRRAGCISESFDSTTRDYPAEAVPPLVPPSPPRSWLNSSSTLMFSVSMLSIVPV